VYDGHEGAAASAYLARALHPALLPLASAAWRRAGSLAGDGLRGALSKACLAANARLTARLRAAGGADGSTAVFAFVAPGQLLVGNVGNSRAVLCRRPPDPGIHEDQGGGDKNGGDEGRCPSNATQPPLPPPAAPPQQQRSQRDEAQTQLMLLPGAGGARAPRHAARDAPGLAALPLTRDHVPARPDEAARVAAAGGAVARAARGGKLRLDGDLEVTRAFGDPGFQSRGLTAEPEFELHALEPGRDTFLILASDGVFEVLAPDEVCAHAWAAWRGDGGAAPRALPPRPAIALPGPAEAEGEAGDEEDARAERGGGEAPGPTARRARPAVAGPQAAGLFGSCGAFGSGAALQRLHSPAAARRAAAGAAPDGCLPPGVPVPFTLPQAVAARVAEEAYNRGSSDNLAVVCVNVGAAAVAAALEREAPPGAGGGVTDAAAEEEAAEEEEAEDGTACAAAEEEAEGPEEEDSAVCGVAGGGGGVDCRPRSAGRGPAAAAAGAVGLSEALAAAAGLSAADGGSGGSCVLLRRVDGAGGATGPGGAMEPGALLEAVGGPRGGGRLAGGAAVVCPAAGHSYELTQHLLDAPALPAHAHVWPLARLPIGGPAAGADG
jgi:serine/threonine protein phosphatase PrpC